MTDNEIIKALECHDGDVERCLRCPYRRFSRCYEKLAEDAIALINRQKAEIERLQRGIDAECDHCGCILLDQRDNARADAVKEFAERLKKEALFDSGWCVLQPDVIDNLVKEFTEGEGK